MSDRNSIAMILLERLGLAPRPEHMFSRADENFRADLLDAMKPEQRAALEQQQVKMWRNDFARSLPLTYQTRDFSDWNSELSNMPAVDRFAYAGRDAPAVMRQPVDPYGGVRIMGNAEYPAREIDTGLNRFQLGESGQ